MVRHQVENRKLVRRECLAQLPHPPAPRVLAPEVVRPEKAALFQIEAQRGGFLVVKADAARLRHHHERTVEQLLVGEPYEEMFRFAARISTDVRLRQLRQAKRK